MKRNAARFAPGWPRIPWPVKSFPDRAGVARRGGRVPVIYYNHLDSGLIYLMVIYTKTVQGNIPAHLLKAIQETIQHGGR